MNTSSRQGSAADRQLPETRIVCIDRPDPHPSMQGPNADAAFFPSWLRKSATVGCHFCFEACKLLAGKIAPNSPLCSHRFLASSRVQHQVSVYPHQKLQPSQNLHALLCEPQFLEAESSAPSGPQGSHIRNPRPRNGARKILNADCDLGLPSPGDWKHMSRSTAPGKRHGSALPSQGEYRD